MNSFVDLHMHSTFSDGSDDLQTLLEHLTEKGIKTFSLTDHDTVSGSVRMKEIVPPDMQFIQGVEFSCITSAGKCHILGYGYNDTNPKLLAAIEAGHQLRRAKLERRIRYLQEVHCISFTEEELTYLYSLSSAGKPHIANLIVKKGLASDITDAIKRLINGHKSGNDRIEAQLAIHAILASGGIPVWAHPLGGEGERHLETDEFRKQLSVLMQAGIKGLECYYSRYSEEEIVFLTKEAEKNGLLISGGSDYHGTNKTVPLGKLNADSIPVSPEQLTILSNRFSDTPLQTALPRPQHSFQ